MRKINKQYIFIKINKFKVIELDKKNVIINKNNPFINIFSSKI